MDKKFRDFLSEIKQTGYLRTRHTKASTLSREFQYYIPLDYEANRTIEFKYMDGRIYGDVIEKLGLLEDILEVISIDQLIALKKIKTENR